MRDEVLDIVRGLSALAVLAGHLRSFILRDLVEIANPSLLTKGFYFLTGFGHQAVMVFFVLSGYLVGGGVCKMLKAGRFSWSHYALARLSRLWVVLLPALLLTWLCDCIGQGLVPEPYVGSMRSVFQSGPLPVSGISSTPATFFGNLLFLQTVEVPVMGTNSPLWSLANEFWYYLLFPLLAIGLTGWRSPWRAGASLLLAGILLAWLPWGLVSKGLIWVLGVAVWWLAEKPQVRRLAAHWAWWASGGFVFLGALVASRAHWTAGSDWAVGMAFAAWMPALLGPLRHRALLRGAGRWLSEISFTLYVVHFPLLFLIVALAFRGRQFEPGSMGYGIYSLLFLTIIATSFGFYWLFESRTDSVRQWVKRRFDISTVAK